MKTIKELIVDTKLSIKTALKNLGKPGEEISFVVDKQGKLIGCLTYGDLRRYILYGGKIDGNISKAYNPNPVYIYENEYSLDIAKELFVKNKKINLIPIVDSNCRLVDSITWAEIFTGHKENNINKELNVPLVIMAGGLGSRLSPLTNVLPKALIPIKGKPIINYIIENFFRYGINEIYITVNHMANILKAYFQEGYDEYNIKFADEKEPLGTVGGLKLIQNDLTDNFFLSTCDIIVDIDLSKLFQFHISHNYQLTLVATLKDYNIPYGVCKLKSKGELKKIIEKPEFNYLINTGLYVLNSSVIKYIPDQKMFHVTNLIDELLKQDIDVGVYPISEHSWIDIGQLAEYKKTVRMFDKEGIFE